MTSSSRTPTARSWTVQIRTAPTSAPSTSRAPASRVWASAMCQPIPMPRRYSPLPPCLSEVSGERCVLVKTFSSSRNRKGYQGVYIFYSAERGLRIFCSRKIRPRGSGIFSLTVKPHILYYIVSNHTFDTLLFSIGLRQIECKNIPPPSAHIYICHILLYIYPHRCHMVTMSG